VERAFVSRILFVEP